MHLGIIADGNGRWAEKRNLPRWEGHEAGASNVKEIVEVLKGRVEYLTLFGFSTENWNRSTNEVRHLFRIMEQYVDGPYLDYCLGHNIRIYHFGRKDRIPQSLKNAIDKAVELTKGNNSMHIGFCLDYGSREELTNAASRGSIENYLYTNPFPDVDLIIRTGGEHRLSNFLLWQSAYAEIYFSDTLFPDLNKEELDGVLSWFKSRERKFGR